jgi:hypothetical protein
MAKRKGSKLKIKIRAVGWQKGRLKGRLNNKRANKGAWKSGKT